MRKGGYKEQRIGEFDLANEALLDRIKGAPDLTITHIGDSMIVLESPHRLYGKSGVVGGGHTLRYRLNISGTRYSHRSFQKFRRSVYDYAREHPEHCTGRVQQAMRQSA